MLNKIGLDFFFFFFQAEDGIRDLTVTGVQTCALPILKPPGSLALLSSSSNTSKYVSVNAAAVVASRGAPALLCPGITTDGCNALIVFNEFNHFLLA